MNSLRAVVAIPPYASCPNSWPKPSAANLTRLIQTGYRIHPNVSNWVGGGFYWEFGIDAVPYSGASGSVWRVVNNELAAR